jgi:hypothetical protein
MPKFNYPDLPEGQEKPMEASIAAGPDKEEQRVWPDSWERRIRLPVSPEITQSFTDGDEATVTLTGKIVGISSNSENGMSRHYIELEASGIDAYPAGESEEDFAAGFDERGY